MQPAFASLTVCARPSVKLKGVGDPGVDASIGDERAMFAVLSRAHAVVTVASSVIPTGCFGVNTFVHPHTCVRPTPRHRSPHRQHDRHDRCAFSTATDQQDGKVLAGIRPNFITTASPADCCALCLNHTDDRGSCTTWVREPATGHCWLIHGGHPEPGVAGRTAGFAPPPAPLGKPTVFLQAYGNNSIRIRLAFGDAPLVRQLRHRLDPQQHIACSPQSLAPPNAVTVAPHHVVCIPLLDTACSIGVLSAFSVPLPAGAGGSASRVWGPTGGEGAQTVTNGNVRAEVDADGIRVRRLSDGAALFATSAFG